MKTEAAKCAKMIKAELQQKFPSIKFSVKSQNYSGGDNVNVSYENGVPEKQVMALIHQYQYGHFDGMIDLYEYSNNREDIPQTKYLFVNRHVSPAIKEIVKMEIAQKFGIKNPSDENEWMKTVNQWSDQMVWRELADKTI